MSERLLTLAEAAEQINMSPHFVRRRVQRREIEFVKLGKSVRIPESELVRFVEQGTVPAREPEPTTPMHN